MFMQKSLNVEWNHEIIVSLNSTKNASQTFGKLRTKQVNGSF